MKKLLLVLVLVSSFISTNAQYNYRDSNRIGVTAGANQFSLNTSDFNTKPDLGWNAGLSVRGNFYNYWDMVYALQFSENNFSVATTTVTNFQEQVNYKLSSAQISLSLSYVIVDNHLSIEFGPLVQVNGKLKIDASDENNNITGTTLLAKDIVDISKFNFYPTVGLTTGVKHVRLNVSYQYGINNMLSNVNKNSADSNLKASAGIINGNIIFYL
jgi:hypothetical protein